MIILDQQHRVLLLRDSDPAYPQRNWWVTPGGGLDPGETEGQAAVREVAEETGLRLTEAELRGPLARRRVRHGFSDRVLDQAEAFFLARVAHFTPDTAGFTESERQTLTEHRWWTPADLERTSEWIWPRQLPALLVNADRPERWPVDLGSTDDESTLAVDSEAAEG